MNNLIFEIGIENIPARFITLACEQMKEIASELLKEKKLSYTYINTFGTYNRLVLYVEGIPAKISEREEKFYGPPLSLLKNEKNEYTPQAIGFAKAHNISPDKLIAEEVSGKGMLLCAIKKIPSIPSDKILSEVLLEILKRLQFPKNMIWEETKFRFARPIRNLVAVFGKKRIPLKVAGVTSSKITTGSILRNSKKININSADDYFKNLEKNHIIVRDDKRKEFLIKELDKLSSRTGIKIDKDEDLILENVYLTEYPVCVFVKFPKEFLELPLELLLLVMKKQLKFFPCYNDRGELQPYFVGIRDGISKGQRQVEEGFLNVFEARCRDALFFYKNDLNLQRDELIEKIKQISFQEKLGSVFDKANRVRRNLEFIVKHIKYEKADSIIKTSENIYLDLATNIVREFPELQGIISYYYAKNWGIEDIEMRKALGEIYYPISSKGKLPSNLGGILLSISEKIDTITGDFLIGIIPTGSQDPHALRRQGYGIVKMILENNLNINIKEFIKNAISNFQFSENSTEKKLNEIMDFIFQRAETYFSENNGTRLDIINSVKDVFIHEGSLLLVKKRISALAQIIESENFSVLNILYKRAKNILRNQNFFGSIDENLFEKEEEKILYREIITLKEKKRNFIEKNDFLLAFREMETLKQPLENFFTNVMVIVEDEKIKNNRLLLLNEIYNLFSDLSDISKIQIKSD